MAQAEYDQLATPLGVKRYWFQCGAYQSARRHVDLVDALLLKWEDHVNRSQQSRDAQRDTHASLFYGTNLWDTWRNSTTERNGADTGRSRHP